MSVFEELDDVIDQLWAEAKHYFKRGEKLFLNAELEQEAVEHQGMHSEANVKAGPILAYSSTRSTISCASHLASWSSCSVVMALLKQML